MLGNRLTLFFMVASSPSDVNECHDESLCTNGQCVNTEGSFYCNCNRPWTPDSNKKKCVMATIAGEWNSIFSQCPWQITLPSRSCWRNYLELRVNLCVLQMWMSVRTQPTVRMATVWTLQGHTTASALHPGPWPPTVTVVWLLRSRPVSVDSLQQEGYEEQQGSGLFRKNKA